MCIAHKSLCQNDMSDSNERQRTLLQVLVPQASKQVHQGLGFAHQSTQVLQHAQPAGQAALHIQLCLESSASRILAVQPSTSGQDGTTGTQLEDVSPNACCTEQQHKASIAATSRSKPVSFSLRRQVVLNAPRLTQHKEACCALMLMTMQKQTTSMQPQHNAAMV